MEIVCRQKPHTLIDFYAYWISVYRGLTVTRVLKQGLTNSRSKLNCSYSLMQRFLLGSTLCLCQRPTRSTEPMALLLKTGFQKIPPSVLGCKLNCSYMLAQRLLRNTLCLYVRASLLLVTNRQRQ